MGYMTCGAGSVMMDSVAAHLGARIAWGTWALRAVICTMCWKAWEITEEGHFWLKYV